MRSKYSGTGAPKVRVLVLGDSGSGKTTLIKRLASESEDIGSLEITRLTIGCHVEVIPHLHRESGTKFFIEFFDVSGSSRYELTRKIFYTQINGILLVFDNTNSVSYNNLKKWIKEVAEENRIHPLEESYHRVSTTTKTPEELDETLSELPVVCVGTKCDDCQGVKDKNKAQQVLKQYGIDCFFLDSLSEKFDRTVLDDFFDRVIERRHLGGKSFSKNSDVRKIDSRLLSRSTDPSPFAPVNSKISSEDV